MYGLAGRRRIPRRQRLRRPRGRRRGIRGRRSLDLVGYDRWWWDLGIGGGGIGGGGADDDDGGVGAYGDDLRWMGNESGVWRAGCRRREDRGRFFA